MEGVASHDRAVRNDLGEMKAAGWLRSTETPLGRGRKRIEWELNQDLVDRILAALEIDDAEIRIEET